MATYVSLPLQSSQTEARCRETETKGEYMMKELQVREEARECVCVSL